MKRSELIKVCRAALLLACIAGAGAKGKEREGEGKGK